MFLHTASLPWQQPATEVKLGPLQRSAVRAPPHGQVLALHADPKKEQCPAGVTTRER